MNQEALMHVENAIGIIKSREGVERASLIHKNGINIKSKPKTLDNQLNEIATISSKIFLLTNKIHEQDWDIILLECRYGRIIMIPLFFDQSDETCPFFLQIVAQPNINLKNLLQNISQPIEKIISELKTINDFEISSNDSILEDNAPLELEDENPNIGATLSNYFGSESFLDIDAVIVHIDGKSLNSMGPSELRLDILTNIHLVDFRSILSYSETLTQLLKKTEISSIQIDYNSNFHFIYPLLTEKTPQRTDFISVTTKSQSKLGFWHLLIPQITKKIENLFT